MEYVYAVDTALVLYRPTGSVELNRGDAWFADDPFVAARPDMFSATPIVCRSTKGRPAPGYTPVLAREPESTREPEPDLAVEPAPETELGVKRGRTRARG